MYYHDKYLEKYISTVYPKGGWMGELRKRDRWLAWTSIIATGSILLLSVGILYTQISSSVGIYRSMFIFFVEMLTFGLMKKKTEVYICKLKDNILHQGKKISWKELKKTYIKNFKKELMGGESFGVEQVERLLESVNEEIHERKPKELVNIGIVGAFILPIWTQIINKVILDSDFVLSIRNAPVISIIVCIIVIAIRGGRSVVYDITNTNAIQLNEMKNILIDLLIECKDKEMKCRER